MQVTTCGRLSPGPMGPMHLKQMSVQICQEKKIDAKSREVAVAVTHAVLLGRHWPTHHACLAGRIRQMRSSCKDSCIASESNPYRY